ncbi:Similar to hypothetical protein [Tuber melanosporum Mel28]; acc. no. XP_002839204 [Pyronema omphalodes CBS 100304]|uniref:BTB domain-containing protein n=1 Tax=Pyronema omphalodes (strain CBS 100304) TaxID=1076935 RepID=U4L5F3_PYROM|nr:Similar to hypothetical protein [Tuber melanosporum Mel28]; acc. no. XP_002839204 [Pyronema omphalodes CBS 100304]
MSHLDENKPQTKRLEICPGGDMEIVLETPEETTYCYIVSSLPLCKRSSVFRAMPGPNSAFSEVIALRRNAKEHASKSSGPYQIRVDNHDPIALMVVLSVIHARTDKFPSEIPFDALMNVAIVCDYYDCATSLHVWVKKWMTKWEPFIKTPNYENWLYIAKVFQRDDILKTLSAHLIERSVVENGEFKVIVSSSPRVTNSLNGHISQEPLLKRRLALCRVLHSDAQSIFTLYEDSTKTQCIHSERNKNCDYYVFGRLYFGFKAAGFLHNPPLYHQYSPNELMDAVTALLESISNCLKTTVFLQMPRGAGSHSHANCANFKDALITTMKSRFKDIGLTIDSPNGEPNEKSWEDLLC